jgi:hypothetical protein
VIDLNYSYQGSNASSIFGTVGTAYIDIMFSPRGGVSGHLSALGPLHFLIRDIRDATTGINPFNVAQSQTARGDVLVLTLFPQTGLVQTFEIDPTDADGNGTMDNPFNFAKQGRSAGR